MQLGLTSAILCLERGCPQGSVSGPIFWNIIINDLLFKLNNLACCEILAFADDILVCSQERNAINIIQISDKSTDNCPVFCYTDGSKIDGRVGFAFVVFRSGVESENFQLRIRDECTVFVAELLCLNSAVKWINEEKIVSSQNISSVLTLFPPWILLNVFLHLTT
ncbi:RNase H domain-containing protein [Trichonephila clavipes]|nr:RNase H domain-containing protein [Trichonephila clavipes]